MTGSGKKKVFFVGASGNVAQTVIPALSTSYSIVGLSKHRKDMGRYFTHLYTADLHTEYSHIFTEIMKSHTFDAVVWSPVRYFPSPILHSSREILHTEFDLAVALPLECIKIARMYGFTENKTFTFVTSGLGFDTKPNWGSYSIAKTAENMLSSSLRLELEEKDIAIKLLALGSIQKTLDSTIIQAFIDCIENTDSGKMLYRVDEDAPK